MKKTKLFTLLALMLFAASVTNVAMGQVRSIEIYVDVDNTSTYRPTQIANGNFNEEPWMNFGIIDCEWDEWILVEGHDEWNEENDCWYNNNTLIQNAYPNGVNEGWNTSESVVQSGTLFEWLEQETINEWSQGDVCCYDYGIEMNAKSSAVLYQDLSTKGYDIIRWSLKHAVRCDYGPNTQSMKVEIGAPEYSGSDIVPAYGINESVNSHIQSDTKAIYTSSGISGSYGSNGENLSGLSLTKEQNDKWYDVRGVYMVPAGQEVTRFAFIATSSGDDEQLSGGNFLDEITFSTLIGNLSAVQLTNGVMIKGYWGETNNSKKLKVKVDSADPVDVDMSSVQGENFVITITGIEAATSLTVYHEDYYAARRTITIHSYSQSITGYTSEANGWYLIASPIGTTVSPSDVTNMTSNIYDIFRFDQSAEMEWQNWEQSGGHYHFNLEPGRGYLYANSSTVTLTFNGTPYSGTGEVNLEYSTANSDSRMRGWNLIGNPYGETATITNDCYKMNNSHNEIIPCTGPVEISAMEGVFVRATAENQSVTFSVGAKRETAGVEDNIVINLNDTKGTVIDRAIVSFDEDHTLPKFQIRDNSTKLYIPQNGKDYAIAFSDRTGEMPLNFKAEKNGSYTLSFSNENIEFGYLHLIDNLTGADIDLLVNPNYTFTAKTTDYESRFRLVFSANDMNDNENKDFAFIGSDGQLIINGTGTIQIIDIMGRVLVTKSTEEHINTHGMTSGVYVLQLITATETKTQKIIVK